MSNNPTDQFKISNLVDIANIGGVDIALTNSAVFMIAAVATISLFLTLSTRGRTLVPNRWQSVAEMAYEFVANTVRSTAGNDGMRFFPFVFTLFTFILMLNLFGMIPYFFTVTSHIIITFALAMLVISVVLIYGIMRHGLRFFKLFMPSGVPVPILFILTPVEIVSFLSRPVSLSLRLFANMMAGHIALKLFASFIVMLGGLGFAGMLGAVLPLLVTVALTALEFLVAYLQAFIFAVLTCVYLHDALHPEH